MSIFQGAHRAVGRMLLILVCYMTLVASVYYPFSLQPSSRFPAHRTAGNHAVLMFSASEYFNRQPDKPIAYMNIWGYPEGGIAKPIAVPALLVGSCLSRVWSPRTAFNLILMCNLLVSAFVVYGMARQWGCQRVPAFVWGAVAIFHPCLQSFVLRAQIENTMLWVVGGYVWAGLVAIESQSRAKQALGLVGIILLPVVAVVSTPYYAIFMLMLAPFVGLAVCLRQPRQWSARDVILYGVASVVGAVLAGLAVQFYRPGLDMERGMIDLCGGTLTLGLAASAPTESFRDVVFPSGMLLRELPYMGLVTLIGLPLAMLVSVVVVRGKRRREMWVWASALCVFAVLALGRTWGPPDRHVLLPMALIDSLFPDFKMLIKLFRGLPIVALCTGAVLAMTLDSLSSRRALIGAMLLVSVVVLDGWLVAPMSVREAPFYGFDEARALSPAIRRIPVRSVEDLPILDLPPPAKGGARLAYAYEQTEHCQRQVWCEIMPDVPTGIMGHALDVWAQLARYAETSSMRDAFLLSLQDSGVRRVILHRAHVLPKEDVLACQILDTLCERIDEDASTIVWAVPDATDEALKTRE